MILMGADLIPPIQSKRASFSGKREELGHCAPKLFIYILNGAGARMSSAGNNHVELPSLSDLVYRGP